MVNVILFIIEDWVFMDLVVGWVVAIPMFRRFAPAFLFLSLFLSYAPSLSLPSSVVKCNSFNVKIM